MPSTTTWNYYVDHFREDSLAPEWFPRFKKLAREIWRLADSDCLDYDIYRQIAHPKTQSLVDVSNYCYDHNETWFREEMMEWIKLVKTGRRYKIGIRDPEIHFLRRSYYYVDLE